MLDALILSTSLVAGGGLGAEAATTPRSDGLTGRPVQSPGAPAPERAWSVFGDLRLRLESDWDSQRADGSRRDDRERLRARARFGVEWSAGDQWRLRVRARTGARTSQQSPHLTFHDFSGGRSDDLEGGLDQWFARAEFPGLRGWIGRNEFPFFYASESQEMLWDRDATLAGIFGAWKPAGAPLGLELSAGGFALPEGLDRWHGTLWAGQAVIQRTTGNASKWRAGLSYLGIEGGGDSSRLLDGNGTRDDRIGVFSLLWTGALRGKSGQLRLGLDGMHNFAAADGASRSGRRDRSDGAVAIVSFGSARPGQPKAGSWELDYAFGHVEKFAVNASYAQDDWVRWGSGAQTDASDLRGHQLGVRRWLTNDLDLHARCYAVESISTAQDGRRLRVDLNYRF